jgi:hypothetical protein
VLLLHPRQNNVQHLGMKLEHVAEASHADIAFAEEQAVDEIDHQTGRDAKLIQIAGGRQHGA